MKNRPSSYASRARYLPFALFMIFIGIEEGLRYFTGQGMLRLPDVSLYYLYPVKILAAASLLLHYRKEYRELRLKDLANLPATALSILLGLVVFVLWINMDWTLSATGEPKGFNTTLLPPAHQLAMTCFRVAGASLLVPVMEELFWRSFLMRYIIDQNMENIPVGTFTWPSFLISSVLFGLEHHFVAAGIMAGLFYSLLLYRTRSLIQCVLAHAVTNFALAMYVLKTGRWYFW